MSALLGAVAALALTVVIEVAVVWLLGGRTRDELLAVIAVNALTNPALSLAVYLVRARVAAQPSQLAGVLVGAFIGAAEVTIVVVEWRLLVWALHGDSRTWLVRSLAMNAASFALGTPLLAAAWALVVR